MEKQSFLLRIFRKFKTFNFISEPKSPEPNSPETFTVPDSPFFNPENIKQIDKQFLNKKFMIENNWKIPLYDYNTIKTITDELSIDTITVERFYTILMDKNEWTTVFLLYNKILSERTTLTLNKYRYISENIEINKETVLFFTSVFVSNALLYDEPLSKGSWEKMTNMNYTKLVKLSFEFLSDIDYNIIVTREEWNSFVEKYQIMIF